jgi:hypothetical protein
MKNCLLLLAVVLALAVGAPAYSQYLYMDVDGDGVNSQATATGDDALDGADTGADIWLDTTKNRDGTPITCNDGLGSTLQVATYEFTIGQSGSGSVSFTGYTNNLTGFTTPLILNDSDPSTPGYDSQAGQAWVYLAGPTDPSAWPGPALLKLGRVAFTVSGTPKLDFVITGTAAINPAAGTSFGTPCFNDNTGDTVWYLGSAFFDNDGTASPTPVVEDTWGKIKNLYR